MTKASLRPVQRQTVDVIEALGFGMVERLRIQDGLPCLDPKPRLVQSIKLDAHLDCHPHGGANLTLKEEFEALFDRLTELDSGLVDIEVRHGLPFRLIIERSLEALS